MNSDGRTKCSSCGAELPESGQATLIPSASSGRGEDAMATMLAGCEELSEDGQKTAVKSTREEDLSASSEDRTVVLGKPPSSGAGMATMFVKADALAEDDQKTVVRPISTGEPFNGSDSDGTIRVNSAAGGEAGMATIFVQRPEASEEDQQTVVKTTGIEDDSGSSAPDATIPLKSASGSKSSARKTSGFSTFMAPGSAGAEVTDLSPESILAGRYKIVRRLGEGGMGAVYKAHDLEVDRIVAIKVIRPELAVDPQILRRFKQELVLSRQVTHRNVARVFDLGAAGGLKFISMEFIEGVELTELIRKQGKLEPKQAANIMLQICQGLEAAHVEGVVHRDLKPQNVMIDSQGRAVVMDFGIAHVVGSASEKDTSTATLGAGLTQVGSLVGTPRYMSPEQARREPTDVRSDIFTVGLIFYELLIGKLPFQAKTTAESLKLRATETAQPPIEVDPKLPKPLNQIIVKCLQLNPADRYESVSGIIHDLEVWLGIRSTVRAGQMKRMRWMAGGLTLLLALASGFIVWNQMRVAASRPHPTVKLLVADFTNHTGEPVLNGTLEPMFQVALEQASFVNTFNRGAAHRIEAELQPGKKQLDDAAARLVALREGLGVIVSGDIEKHNEGYRLSVKAINTEKGDTLISRDADADVAADLPKAVDELAARIRRALGDRAPGSKTVARETFTAASLDAAQKYSQAQDLQLAGKWEDAIASYQRAIELDPNLSRAYSGLAAMLANRGRRQEAQKYYQLALAKSDRMSDREKFRTRGGYYLFTRDYQRATEQFKQLVSQYPADTAGIANLALSYFYARNMSAALQEGQRAVDIYPNNLSQRNNVALYAMYAGDFDRAIRAANAIIEINPKFDKAYLCLAMAHLGKGEEKDALAAYGKLSELSAWGASVAALGRADVAMYRGRMEEASGLLEKGIEEDLAHKNESAALTKRVALASVQLLRRRNAAASENATKALESSAYESILYPSAMVLLQTGGTAKALAAADKLGARFEPEPRATAKLIQGEALLKAGKFHEAVAAFQEAQKLADTWLGHYGLGRAYLAAGVFPDADAEFDVCLKRRGEATAVFLDDDPTLRYLPPVYYYQGRAREGLNSSGAAESFRTFLSIKQMAEDDAMVTDAKRRMK